MNKLQVDERSFIIELGNSAEIVYKISRNDNDKLILMNNGDLLHINHNYKGRHEKISDNVLDIQELSFREAKDYETEEFKVSKRKTYFLYSVK